MWTPAFYAILFSVSFFQLAAIAMPEPATRLFVIPGNPPARHFYELWKNEWLARNPSHQFSISDYKPVKFQQESVRFMSEVADSHRSNFETFRRSNPSGRVVVIGHSLGGYFARELLESHHREIDQAILIHPFLRAPAQEAKQFLKNIHRFQGIAYFENVILWAKPLLGLFLRDLPSIAEAEAAMALRLAFHEYQTIAVDQKPVEFSAGYRNKLKVYYTKNDQWCTLETAHQIARQVETFLVDSTHDFIRVKKERDKMTDDLKRYF